MFYRTAPAMSVSEDRLFELARRTFDTPHFRGIEFIEVEAKSIINHVPGNYLPFNWTINPYRGCAHACTYCFARVTHTYMDMDAGRDFESKIVVKINAPQLVRRELRARRWKGEHIAMGTGTDPYQRAEGRYKLMRGIIGNLTTYRNPFSILTKGTLILRDLDLLQEASSVTDVTTAFSIGTLDEDAWRKSEPGTPHPSKRMAAVKRLNEAGIPCGVMVAPILPGITDDPKGLREVVVAALDSGATHVSPILLHLRPGVKEVYMAWLEKAYPDLVPRYMSMYQKAYATSAERETVGGEVASLLRSLGGVKRPEAHRRTRGRPRSAPGADRPEKGASPEQLELL